MSGDDGFITSVTASLSSALAPLADAEQLVGLLAQLGWPAQVGTDVVEQFGPTSSAIAQLVADADAGASAVTLVADVAEAITALGGLRDVSLGAAAAPFNDPAFWAALPEDLLGLLVSESLEMNAPGVYGVLSLLGVLTTTPVEADAASGRGAYVSRTIDWSALVRSVAAPQTLMGDTYGWGGDLDHGRLLTSLAAVIAGVGGAAALMPLHRTFAEPFVSPDNPDRRTMKQLVIWPFVLPAATLGARVRPALVVTPLPPAGAPSSRPVGLLLSPTLTGSAQATIGLRGGAVLSLTGELQASPQRIGLRPSGATRELAMADGDLEVRVDIAPPAPLLLGGTPDGTRFELARAHLALAASGSDSDLLVEIEVGLDDATAVIDLSQADSFVSGLIGAARYELPMAMQIDWSSETGLQFAGSATPSFTVPVDIVIGGVLRIAELHVSLGPSGSEGAARLAVAATGAMDVGPIVVTFDQLGIAVDTTAASFDAPGNFGLVDVALGFKPPEGVGVGVDVGIVSGGGYLDIDAEAGSYDGVLDLDVLGVGISAVAIIDTKLPDVDGWSMFFALFLDLPSIQLGFGFTLEGVGGVAGINRAIDVDALGSAVRSGSLDTILFPPDPIADAPIIIEEFRSIFPPADGSYVFGPIVKIGWGTPTLIEAELGIIIQLPDPLVIVVLGSLSAVLPSKDLELVALNLDVAGVIDFEAGTLAIDASLHDSHVVGFALSGDMALRAEFGNAQAFLMSVGGFHPRFDPPGDFPDLRPVTFGITAGSVLRIDFMSYFALTSNSVQCGADFTLDADVLGFGVYGSCGFDALIQFSPFMVITSVDFEVSITAAGVDLMGVMLYASVEGPNRWHVIGTARFEVLGFGKDIRVDELIGSKETEPAVEAAEVLVELLAVLATDDAWQVIEANDSAVTLQEIDDPDAPLMATPDSVIEVRQTLVPLGIDIEQFGNAPAGEHSTFELTAVGLEQSGTLDDWFAPGQFFELGNDDKLEGPEFELMRSGIQFGGGTPIAGPDVGVDTGYKAYIIDPEFPEEETFVGKGVVHVLDGVPAMAHTQNGFTAVHTDTVATTSPTFIVVDDRGVTVASTTTWSAAYTVSVGRSDLHIERELGVNS